VWSGLVRCPVPRSQTARQGRSPDAAVAFWRRQAASSSVARAGYFYAQKARVMAEASDVAMESYPAHMTDSPLSPEEIRAAAEVHRELGPEYGEAVVASFLEKVDREIAARVEARLASTPRTEPAKPGSRRMLLMGMAIGLAVGGIPILLLLVLEAGRGSQAAVSSSAAGGNATQVVVSHSSHSVAWLLLLFIVVAICALAAVRVVRKQRAAGPL